MVRGAGPYGSHAPAQPSRALQVAPATAPSAANRTDPGTSLDWLWIPITIAAALFQSLRTALQKFLKGRLSTNGSTFTRFVFGLPVAAAYVGVLAAAGVSLPVPGADFFTWVLLGGVAQILATALLIHVLGFRNFPVGVAYSKTEVVQAALFGFVFLGDQVTALGAAAVAAGTAGVMLFSVTRSDRPIHTLLFGLAERPALLGIASGAFFGVAAVGFRGASLSLDHPSVPMSAAYALAWATGLQTLLLGTYLAWRERDQFARILAAWRPSLLAGLASVAGSACWFTAMTLQPVAHVRTLGLIELVFTFLLSAVWFRERPSGREVAGIALLAVAIVLILNAPGP